MGTGSREVISGRLSAEAAHGWRAYCARQEVSVSALLEAAGLAVADGADAMTATGVEAVLDRARQIDADRRRRR